MKRKRSDSSSSSEDSNQDDQENIHKMTTGDSTPSYKDTLADVEEDPKPAWLRYMPKLPTSSSSMKNKIALDFPNASNVERKSSNKFSQCSTTAQHERKSERKKISHSQDSSDKKKKRRICNMDEASALFSYVKMKE